MRPIRLLWMYPDIMDLYGDSGNILVFEKRCAWRNIPLEIITCSIGEEVDFNTIDILFMGGGADREQGKIFADLVKRKDAILKAMENGMLSMLICGGYQLFGKYYEDSDGVKLDGLGIFDYYTIADGKTRSIGNIAIEVELMGETISVVGFENHGGQTYSVQKPLGKVLAGGGNCHDGYEGYFDGKTLGTYLHGPLLPKNPEIADYFISEALKLQGSDMKLQLLNDSLAKEAKNSMLNRILQKKD